MIRQVIRRVDANEAVARWSDFEPHVRRVLERLDSGQYPDDVLTAIQFGGMHLWDILDGTGVCVTELQAYSRYRQLLVYLVAGGNARDWIAEGQQQLEAFAKSQNCKYMWFQGRPGWERYCKRLGYSDKLVMMRKAL